MSSSRAVSMPASVQLLQPAGLPLRPGAGAHRRRAGRGRRARAAGETRASAGWLAKLDSYEHVGDACDRRCRGPVALNGAGACPRGCWRRGQLLGGPVMSARNLYWHSPHTLGAIANRRQGRRFPGTGDSFERLDLIAIGQNKIDSRPLGFAQVRIVVEDGLARARWRQRCLRALARPASSRSIPAPTESRPGGRELTARPRRAVARLATNSAPSTRCPKSALTSARWTSPIDRLERIPQQVLFIDDGLTFKGCAPCRR